MKIAHFVSTFEYYKAEKSGDKPYTIRDATILNLNKLRYATHICIHKGYTKESFTRKLTYQLIWKDNIIASWNPINQNKGDK